jgi:hypothetical protein
MFDRFRRPKPFTQRVRSLIPSLTDADKKDLSQTYRILHKSFFEYLHWELLENTTNSLGSRHFSVSSIIGHSLLNSFDIILHPAIEIATYVLFKPDITKLPIWISLKSGTSVLSSLVVHGIRVVSQNLYIHGTLSLNGFSSNLLPYIGQRVGFSTGMGLARYFLPEAADLGGTYAREVAVISIGFLGGRSLEWLADGGSSPFSRVLTDYVRDLSSVAVQAMYLPGSGMKVWPLLLGGIMWE